MATKTYSIIVNGLDGTNLLTGNFVVNVSTDTVAAFYNDAAPNVNILKDVGTGYTNYPFYVNGGFNQGYNTNVYNRNISGSVEGITRHDIDTFFLPLIDIGTMGATKYIDLDCVCLHLLPNGMQYVNNRLRYVNGVAPHGSFISIRSLTGSYENDVNVNIQIEEIVTSSACFPKGTPVQTDQGHVSIDKLVPSLHTISGKEIIAVTKTVSIDKHLICFEKDALYENVPDRQTLVSMSHKFLYNGAMTRAKDLAEILHGVYKVTYSGEILYNVLLEKHDTMMVNNLIAETLHEGNKLAILARLKIT